MRRAVLAIFVLTIGVTTAHAQGALTAKQREDDLIELASTYAKAYGPYEWKRDVFGFDLYRLTPWLQQIQRSDDLDFEETLIEYVASLNDSHATMLFPSPFTARLGFTVDIYDGKVLIDSINRALLPQAQYPFAVGDELVALDGEPVESIVASLRRLGTNGGNPRSRDRISAGRIVTRSQQSLPHASQVGETAVASIRLASTGVVTNYTISWTKSGVAVDSQSPLPSPRRGNAFTLREADPDGPGAALATSGEPVLLRKWDFSASDDSLPAYMDPMRPLLVSRLPETDRGVLGVGSRTPIYSRPAGFVTRLGTQSSHFFFSGTYVSNGVRIGLLRIPSENPPSTSVALQQLNAEIAFFNANTDVLVVDITRNPGGTISTAEAFAQRLIPNGFRTLGFELRATLLWVVTFEQWLILAENSGAPADVIQNLQANLDELLQAYNERRGRTAPLPLNTLGRFEVPPAAVAYTKPLLVLVDDFTASGGDMLAALLQDSHRGPLLGMRTNGAGGTNFSYDCTTFTEATCSTTLGLMNRGVVISTPEFPPSPYIENIGVRPDIVVDYMTRANLMTGGAPFVRAFTDAAVELAGAPH